MSHLIYQEVKQRKGYLHKCAVCGRLIHLECAMSRDLVAHILEDHGFRIDSKKSVLWGTCEDCKTP